MEENKHLDTLIYQLDDIGENLKKNSEANLITNDSILEKVGELSKLLDIIAEVTDKNAEKKVNLLIDGVEAVSVEGPKGEDGYTPKKGEDYFTEKEIKDIVKQVKDLIPDPKDGENGQNGYTPEKGKDYFTDEEITNLINEVTSRIPTPENGKDAVVDYEKIKQDILSSLNIKNGKDGKDGKDGSPDTGEQIVEKINKLPKSLDWKVIKNAPEIKGGGSGLNTVSVDGVTIAGNGLGDNPLRVIGSVGGATAFINLTDVPHSYTGQSGKAVRVKSTEDGLEFFAAAGSGTVTSVSVVSANGFAGTVANASTTPAITLTTSITGILKGNGTSISAGTDGTDYLSSSTGLKLDQTTPQTITNDSPIFNTLTASKVVFTTSGKKLTSTGIGTSGQFIKGDGSLDSTAYGTGTVTSVAQSFTGGLISVSGSPITGSGTLALTVAGTSGGIPYFSSASTWASSGALTANALMIGGGAGSAPSTTTTGSGILTFLGTPSSANLASAITDETGSGALMFGTDPSLTISSPGTTTVGYLGLPQQSKSANYTTVMSDSGKHIYHPSGDANARTFTIDSNSNVAYPIGTTLTFINETSQVVTIAITSDTLVLAGTGSTGSRSLAQYGMATAVKVTSTRWYINGSGLS